MDWKGFVTRSPCSHRHPSLLHLFVCKTCRSAKLIDVSSWLMQVEELIIRVGRFARGAGWMKAAVPCEQRFNYRNKVRFCYQYCFIPSKRIYVLLLKGMCIVASSSGAFLQLRVSMSKRAYLFGSVVAHSDCIDLVRRPTHTNGGPSFPFAFLRTCSLYWPSFEAPIDYPVKPESCG